MKKKIRPGVKALIVRDNKVLLVHETVVRNGCNMEIIDFPGGGVEFGESLHEALKREVKEEVNLNIEIIKVVGAWDFILRTKNNNNEEKNNTHIICIGYQCRVIGKINIDVTKNPAQENIYKAKWYLIEDVLKNKILKRKGMIEAINNLSI